MARTVYRLDVWENGSTKAVAAGHFESEKLAKQWIRGRKNYSRYEIVPVEKKNIHQFRWS